MNVRRHLELADIKPKPILVNVLKPLCGGLTNPNWPSYKPSFVHHQLLIGKCSFSVSKFVSARQDLVSNVVIKAARSMRLMRTVRFNQNSKVGTCKTKTLSRKVLKCFIKQPRLHRSLSPKSTCNPLHIVKPSDPVLILKYLLVQL